MYSDETKRINPAYFSELSDMFPPEIIFVEKYVNKPFIF